uniref:Uncharacterized protein n=1 Tax=Arundo donax TaxID=35708 RepID=A0A0A9A787_ARUDO
MTPYRDQGEHHRTLSLIGATVASRPLGREWRSS